MADELDVLAALSTLADVSVENMAMTPHVSLPGELKSFKAQRQKKCSCSLTNFSKQERRKAVV